MVGKVFDEGVVIDHMQKAAMRAVVPLATIKAVADAFFKMENLMAPIATFVSNYVEEE